MINCSPNFAGTPATSKIVRTKYYNFVLTIFIYLWKESK